METVGVLSRYSPEKWHLSAASGHWVTGLTWFWLGTVLDADQSLSDSRLSHCFGWKSGRVNMGQLLCI